MSKVQIVSMGSDVEIELDLVEKCIEMLLNEDHDGLEKIYQSSSSNEKIDLILGGFVTQLSPGTSEFPDQVRNEWNRMKDVGWGDLCCDVESVEIYFKK